MTGEGSANPAWPAAVGLIGAGSMGGALARAWAKAGLVGDRLTVCDVDRARAEALSTEIGCRVAATGGEAVSGVEAVVLAMKPQDLARAATEIGTPPPGATLISILAGVRTGRLTQRFGPGIGVVRAMPNLGVTVGRGVTAVIGGAGCGETDLARAESLLGAAGVVVRLEQEDQMDAVTAVSGSGPAYFFLLAEAMAEAGAALGLPAELAERLASGTAMAAGRLLEETAGSAGELRARVTSRKGTTERAIEAFEGGGLRSLVRAAVAAAEARSRELAEG